MMCCFKLKFNCKIVDKALEVVNMSQSIFVVLTIKRLAPLTTASIKRHALYLLW